jgi:hypothetical protein
MTFGSLQQTRGSAVPKFGDWDSNPASADGYTLIFNKVREEKQTQPGKPAAYGNGGKQHDDGYVSSVSGAARPDPRITIRGSLVCSSPCLLVLLQFSSGLCFFMFTRRSSRASGGANRETACMDNKWLAIPFETVHLEKIGLLL